MELLWQLLEGTARGLGDAIHILSFLVLIVKIRRTKSCSGISLKAQILALCVFLWRYLDVYYVLAGHTSPSLMLGYNTVMKIVFISLQGYVVYVIKFKYFYTYDVEFDRLPLLLLIMPSLLGGLFFADYPVKLVTYRVVQNTIEWLWTSSVILEAVSIMPQLSLLSSTGEGEALTVHYVIFLGIYRVMYIVAWTFRWISGSGRVLKILLFSSIIQTLLYSDFFYVYLSSFIARGKKIRVSPQKFFEDAFGKNE